MNSKQITKLTVKEIGALDYFTKSELRKLSKKELIERLQEQLIPGSKAKTVANLKFIQERE